jgi:oligosaccharide repeat unit polymerase
MDFWLANMIGLAGAVVLLALVIRKTGDPASFATVFSLAWGLNLLISQAQASDASRPTVETTLLLYLAWWAFLLGSLVRFGRSQAAGQPTRELDRQRGIAAIIILVALQFAAVIYEISASELSLGEYLRSFIEAFPSLRLSGQAQAIDLPWFLEIWRWAFAVYLPMAFYIRYRGMISRSFLLIVLLMALLSTPLRVTRTPILHVAIIIFTCWTALYRPKWRSTALAGAGLLSLFLVIFVRLQSTLVALDPLSQSLSTSESLYSYIGGPAKAYDLLLRGYYPDRVQGVYTLDAVTFVLEKLGLYADRPSLIRPYVFVPYPTNVFTFLDAFTLDLGVAGALLGSFLTGLLTAWVYWRMRNKLTVETVIAYSYLVYCCAMTPLNNEFIRFSVPFNLLLAWILSRATSRRESTRKSNNREGWARDSSARRSSSRLYLR